MTNLFFDCCNDVSKKNYLVKVYEQLSIVFQPHRFYVMQHVEQSPK